MAGRAPQRSLPAAAAAALLLLPIVLHCESTVNLPLSVLLEKYCEALSARTNVTGLFCNATTDQIGTCWPRTSAGELVERPCPEFFNGIKYNTTRNAYRECLGNGTWASKINYSQCEPILDDKRKYALHYKIALIINYLGHCISVGALIVAFMLFLCLRSFQPDLRTNCIKCYAGTILGKKILYAVAYIVAEKKQVEYPPPPPPPDYNMMIDGGLNERIKAFLE